GARNEIWLMGPNAENPRRILAGQKEVWFSQVAWSLDAQRIAYIKHRRKNNEVALEILDLPAGQPTVVLSDLRLGSFCWGRDGRIVYALAESPPNETSSNLWEIQPPSRPGRSPERPRRLTN